MRKLIQCSPFIVLLIFTYTYYRDNLQLNSTLSHKYLQAAQILNQVLIKNRDLAAHHFQPCKGCGFHLAINRDPQFCIKSDGYKLLHPDTVYKDMVIFREYAGKDLARQLIKQESYDALPTFVQTGRQNFSRLFNLPKTASVLYPYAKNYLRTHPLGTAGGCLFQKYAHVPGQEEIALKSNQSHHFRNYLETMANQNLSKECIDDASYFKPTYRMWIEEDCQYIFSQLNSETYKTQLSDVGIKYIFKTNRHLGGGIILMDYMGDKLIRGWYKNGAACGVNNSQSIMQEYIMNPYLYNGHKMEFRSYFAIASTNPPILYSYKVALIKQCGLKFDLKDFTKESHVCNTAVVKSLQEKDSKEDEDDVYIDWNLEELQDLLLSQKKITSKNWLDEVLRPQIYRKVTHLYMSVKDLLFEDSRVNEFFGVDFIMDDNLRLWILECNRNPNFLAVTEGRKDKFGRLISDMMDLSMLYIRSKYQRVRKFVNDNLLNQTKLSVIKEKEFMSIQEDYLEKEFQLPKDTLYELIYVGSNNTQRYKYTQYVKPECIIQ